MEASYNYLTHWSDSLLAVGRFGFSLTELKEKYTEHSSAALKLALKRMTDKGKILSVFKGYYLIIPPQYTSKGILPPNLFLDALMKHLGRPYYISLLNAAAFYGAAHQQPQEYFVMTVFPALRATQKKGLKINYISINEIPQSLLEKRKTEAGYIYISNPLLTACDLIQFEKRIGGLSRATTVLNELTEVLKPLDFKVEILNFVHITTLQRLGYLLKFECHQHELAETLFQLLQKYKACLFRTALKPSQKTKGFPSDNRWKVIENAKIELDE